MLQNSTNDQSEIEIRILTDRKECCTPWFKMDEPPHIKVCTNANLICKLIFQKYVVIW